MAKEKKLPLCIDLDGTLIRSDVTHECVLLFIRKYPWKFFYIFVWLCRGRAFLKAKLAENVMINPSLLPYNKKLLSYLKNKTKEGYDLYLVTAADKECAKIVCNYLKIFKDYLASDGVRNLRAATKAKALCERFGNEKFIYAGNSRHDLPVWSHSAKIIAVNTPTNILEKARTFYKKMHIFQDKPLTFEEIYKDITLYTMFKEYMLILILIKFLNVFEKTSNTDLLAWAQNFLWWLALLLNHTSAILLGMLFQIESVRKSKDMDIKDSLFSTGRLTIVQISRITVFLLIISHSIALLLPDIYFYLFMLVFMCRFLISTKHILIKDSIGF